MKIPPPVIVIHGAMLKEWWTQDLYLQPYHSLYGFLNKNGYDADVTSDYRTVWGPTDILFSPPDASPVDMVEQMDSWINNALRNTSAEKVNIIGISLGGLVGRYYITEHNASKIHKLIMVSGVNEGSTLFGKLIASMPSRAEAQAHLRNSEGKLNILNWLFPAYQYLFTPDGKEITPPFKNLFHEDGYDKPAPQGVHYYSIFSGERETPYQLIAEEKGDWYKVIGDKQMGKGDGNGLVQSSKTFGYNILVPSRTHHTFMLGDPKIQSAILEALEEGSSEPSKGWYYLEPPK